MTSALTPAPACASPLEFAAVTRRYGATTALADFTFTFTPGRTTALLGPSGCGKSTILRLAIGLVAPDRGEVRLFGQALREVEMESARHRVGYVIQQGGLFPNLDVRANVTLVARHLGWSAARIAARFDELLSLVKLPGDIVRRSIDEVSGGQRQRVSLMRALMLDPPLLLLDEPLGALDPMVRSEMQDDLRALFGALGKTVVLVTHDVAECAQLADEVVLLRDGRIEQRGLLAELMAAPEGSFARAFVTAQRGARQILEDRVG